MFQHQMISAIDYYIFGNELHITTEAGRSMRYKNITEFPEYMQIVLLERLIQKIEHEELRDSSLKRSPVLDLAKQKLEGLLNPKDYSATRKLSF